MTPDQLLTLIENQIARLQFGDHPKSLYEPIRYIMGLGGKRMRPLLTSLSYSLYRDDVERVIPYAVAVEAFHNFTLLHDDIMDKAPLRRGKPTVHEKWNVNTAILAGDVMLVKVYEMLLSLPGEQLKEVLFILNRTACAICEGQQLDMEFETSKKVLESDYLNMIRLKTAVLLGFSLELGAVLASASREDRQALYAFGVNVGIGFQLKDDLLDVYASQRKFGKQVGGDIISNKKTFLLVKALETAKGKNKIELNKWLSAKKFDQRKKVAVVTHLYNELNIPQLTEVKINHFFAEGYRSLEKVSSGRKGILLKFAQDLATRQR